MSDHDDLDEMAGGLVSPDPMDDPLSPEYLDPDSLLVQMEGGREIRFNPNNPPPANAPKLGQVIRRTSGQTWRVLYAHSVFPAKWLYEVEATAGAVEGRDPTKTLPGDRVILVARAPKYRRHQYDWQEAVVLDEDLPR